MWVAVVDPGERPGSLPHLFLDQTEAQKFFLGLGPVLSRGVVARPPPPPPPYLKVWICHWVDTI